MVKGNEECPEVIKIELLSTKDYYFLYEHTNDVFEYEVIKEQQCLTPPFQDYLTMLIKLFN